MIRTLIVAAASLSLLAGTTTASTDDPKPATAAAPVKVTAKPVLIPRRALFGNPDRAGLEVSPDGKRVAFLSPVAGVLNVWVAPIDDLAAAKPVTLDTGRGIRQYFWAYSGTEILYLQDKGGDENWKLYRVNLDNNAVTDLTPFEEILDESGKPMMVPSGQKLRPTARMFATSHRFPNEVIVGLNNRDPQWHDAYRLDLKTGHLTLMYRNDGFSQFLFDDDFNLRMGAKMSMEGAEFFKATITPGKDGAPAEATWTSFIKVPQDDALTTSPSGFSGDGKLLYMTDSRGRDTGALFSIDLATDEKTLIAEDTRADAGGVMVHPTTGIVQAVSFEYTRREWKVLDKSIQADLDFLASVAPGQIDVLSRSIDDNVWGVSFMQDNGPAKFYVYNREAKTANFAFTNRKALIGAELQPMKPVVIKSRDGLDLVSYLTLPPRCDANNDGVPDQPVPMVLDVHGGPWARDSWGYNGEAQWLANRGYAVLSVNFRGSTGFGKKFLNAGNKEWAAAMHNDLLDAMDWAVKQGIADSKKVAVYGGSYGGYAALVAVTFTPETFACAVDIVGPSNLNTLLGSIPPYWKPLKSMFAVRVGDMDTEEGRKFLESRSPLNFIDRIKRPLLIGQGQNDPRVKVTEAEQIVDAMKKKGIPVTYVLYPDEGHGFARPENRMSFYAVTEAFLAKHLGGRAEPINDDFKGSSLKIKTGVEDIPGLSDAVNATTEKGTKK